MLKFVGGLAGNHIWPDDWVFLYGCSDTDQVISRQKLIVNIHTYCLLARLLLDSIFYCYKDGCPTDLNLLLSTYHLKFHKFGLKYLHVHCCNFIALIYHIYKIVLVTKHYHLTSGLKYSLFTVAMIVKKF